MRSGCRNEETEAQAPEKAKDRLYEAVRLPDLETTIQTDVAPLRIKDPRLYFEVRSVGINCPKYTNCASAIGPLSSTQWHGSSARGHESHRAA